MSTSQRYALQSLPISREASADADNERIDVAYLEEEGGWKIICPSSSLKFNPAFVLFGSTCLSHGLSFQQAISQKNQLNKLTYHDGGFCSIRYVIDF